MASSWASQSANSTEEKTESSAGTARSLATVSRQTSSVSPRGAKYSVLALMPFLAELIVVYDRPCLHS